MAKLPTVTEDSSNVTQLSNTALAGQKLARNGKTALKDLGSKMRQLANLKPGSETIRTPELIEAIVQRLLEGEALLSICSDPDMPSSPTIQRWMRDDPELSRLIDWGRQQGAHVLIDAIQDIASGGMLSTGEGIERDAMLIKALMYVASKRNAAVFGDKIQVTSSTINYTVTKGENDW